MADVVHLEGGIGPERGARDRSIAALAGRQHGLVSHGHLVALDLSGSAIQKRVASGRLHRVHRGVYAVGHALLGPNGRLLAAVLACGPGALLSHRSAAALWGLLDDSRAVVDVVSVRNRGGGGESSFTARAASPPRTGKS